MVVRSALLARDAIRMERTRIRKELIHGAFAVHALSQIRKLGFCLRLNISHAAIKTRSENEQNRREKHQQSEEPEVGRVFKIKSQVADARHPAAQDGGEMVTKCDREKPSGHDCALHLLWRLGVGKLQAGDGYHDFAG